MKETHYILGIHVTDRVRHVPGVQPLLTEYGCHIRTRLGLHEAGGQVCSPNGMILLELVGDQARCDELGRKLAQIEGVEVQQMVFKH